MPFELARCRMDALKTKSPLGGSDVKETAIIDDDFDWQLHRANVNSERHSPYEERIQAVNYLNLDSARETSLIDDERVDSVKQNVDVECFPDKRTDNRLSASQEPVHVVFKSLPGATEKVEAASPKCFSVHPSNPDILDAHPISQAACAADRTDENDDTDSAYLSMLRSGDTSDCESDLDKDHRESEAIKPDSETDFTRGITFQDIESDFFEDEDDGARIAKVKTLASPKLSPNKDLDPHAKLSLAPIDRLRLEAPNTLNGMVKTTSSMSNTLLRATIKELQNALSGTNRLLAERDEEIASARVKNAELKASHDQVCSDCSRLQKEVESLQAENKGLRVATEAEKESLRQEKDLRIIELSNQLLTLSGRLDELERNGAKRRASDAPEISRTSEQSTVTGLKSCQPKEIPDTPAMHVSQPKKGAAVDDAFAAGCGYANSCRPDHQRLDTTSVARREKREPSKQCLRPASMYVEGDGSAKNTRNGISVQRPSNSDRAPQDCDRASQGDLHAQLQMKFMRDAFFYYMIGFHPEEQISAILAILDYGDKRQDLVLEAHKMRMLGKKFNASKVSSRGLTFVQTEFRS